MRTTQGPQRVDVIYRRIDDDFLDPLVFRPDSMLGVPGLLDRLPRRPHHHRQRHRHRRRRRQVDLSLRARDDPLLPRPGADHRATSHTWMLRKPEDLDYVLAHLPELVVKEVHGAGGYGMLIGPAATKAEIEHFRRPIIATPERYIAQPTLALSTCPTFADAGPRAPAHRPAALRAVGPGRHHRSRRPHPRGAARRLAGRQLLARRRHQGHLGAGELTC